MEFNGKVALVTGGSSGIGSATAIAFASKGAHVVIVGRNLAKLQNVAVKCQQHGCKPLVIIADVSKEEGNKRIMDETVTRFGRLDILVNNAGYFKTTSILSPDSLEVFDAVMNTNLRSIVHLTHLAAPHLIRTKGNIINVSSIAALSVFMLSVGYPYLVSKAAVDHLTRATALELAPQGVRVNGINPGAVRTDILENNGISAERADAKWEMYGQLSPLKRLGQPEEIADLVLFLASDKARCITGASVVSDSGALLSGFPVNKLKEMHLGKL